MEFLVALGVLSAGYLISQEGKLPSYIQPNTNRDFQRVQGSELIRGTQNYAKFRKGDPNKIIGGPPQSFSNFSNFKSPGESDETKEMDSDTGSDFGGDVEENMTNLGVGGPNYKHMPTQGKTPEETFNSRPVLNKVDFTPNFLPMEYVPAGEKGSTKFENAFPGAHGESLTGKPIDPKNFTHNNMVPFFGSSVKQNVDDRANSAHLENFTGQGETYRMKKEVGRFFPLQTNVSNPYGMQNLDGNQREYYYPSNKRHNEAPIQPLQVGPGLNKGYTNLPSGGVQQAETRDYVIPKTVDEMRVKTNPKVSYAGRVISGKHISRRGVIGLVEKNNPDSFYINSPDRYFTTVGECTGPRQRAAVVLKSTNRKETESNKKFHMAPAGPAEGISKSRVRSQKVQRPRKNVYKNETLYRNLDAVSRWAAKYFDYGKESFFAKEQNRQCTQKNKYLGPAGTKVKKNYVKNPNDKARTTIKETTIDNNRLGVAAGRTKNYIKDPNDKARTTIKETTIDNNYLGGVSNGQLVRAYVRKPRKAKTTQRESTSREYFGDVVAKGIQSHGYLRKKMKAKKTNRCDTNRENFGGASAAVPKEYVQWTKKTQRQNINKERIARGRTPGKLGPKKITGKDMVRMTTKRMTDTKNQAILRRGVMSTKVYNSLPGKDSINYTHERSRVPNQPLEKRLDPGILDAFRKNPYTKPLDAWAL